MDAHCDENGVNSGQIREIGCESRQEVIERLDGSLHLGTKQAPVQSCKRCSPNGHNEKKNVRGPEPRRAAQFPLRALSLGAKWTSDCEAKTSVWNV